MGYDQFRRQRRSIRIQQAWGRTTDRAENNHEEEHRGEAGHGKPCPYTVGAFFVTICTHERECLFGEIGAGTMRLSSFGEIVQEEWHNVSRHRPNVTLDAFIVMPNHVHGIVILRQAESGQAEQQFLRPIAGSLGMVVGGFKSAVSRRINVLRDTPGAPVWHRNYHEKIARDERMLNNARRYIANNPKNWADDLNNPANMSPSPEG